MVRAKGVSALREMPNSQSSEVALLGSIFLRPNSIEQVVDIIRPGDFYRSNHRNIYEAMTELYRKRDAIDVLTVSDSLEKQNLLEQVGGMDYLSELSETVPTSYNIASYANIIANKAMLRALLETCHGIVEKGYSSSQDAREIVDEAEKLVFEVGQREIKSSVDQISEVVQGSLKAIKKYFEEGDKFTGVPTGFERIDDLTNGLQPGELTILAARPSMGKSALALNIAANIGLTEKSKPVVIFTLEMSKETCGMRMLSTLARVDLSSVRKGEAKENDFYNLTQAGAALYEAPIYIDDTGFIGTDEIRAKSRRLKAQNDGLSLIIIDYIQLMKPREGIQSREQQISDISRSLKAIAKEMHVPVMALSQLNRGVENREDKRPRLADIRESGAVEQDADMIMFIYRAVYYKPQGDPDFDPETENQAEVILAKNRNGPTGHATLVFLNKFARFENLEMRREDSIPY